MYQSFSSSHDWWRPLRWDQLYYTGGAHLCCHAFLFHASKSNNLGPQSPVFYSVLCHHRWAVWYQHSVNTIFPTAAQLNWLVFLVLSRHAHYMFVLPTGLRSHQRTEHLGNDQWLLVSSLYVCPNLICLLVLNRDQFNTTQSRYSEFSILETRCRSPFTVLTC